MGSVRASLGNNHSNLNLLRERIAAVDACA
jgi:hypothetical protein